MFNTFMFDVPIFSFMGGLRGGVEVPSPLVIYDHQQVGQLERMAMNPKRLALVSDNSVINTFISSGPRKLNYRRFGRREDVFLF